MRGTRLASLTLVAIVAATGVARGQSYGQGGEDPCRPAAPSTSGGYGSGGYSSGGYGSGLGALGMLTNMISQPHRSSDCAALRRSQWAEYNAKQKAARDKVEADAAAQKQAAATVDAAKIAAAAQVADAHAAVVVRRAAASAAARRERGAARADEVRTQREAAVEAARVQRVAAAEAARGQRTAALAQRAAYVRMVAAENAPDNMCRQPKVARAVMDGWNELDAFHAADVHVIDIEHFTTVAWHAADQTFACHGVFVTNKGWRVVGTALFKKNVAGDPMFVWQRDGTQDLANYEAPAMDAGSPEVESQVKVSGASAGLREAVSTGVDGRM